MLQKKWNKYFWHFFALFGYLTQFWSVFNETQDLSFFFKVVLSPAAVTTISDNLLFRSVVEFIFWYHLLRLSVEVTYWDYLWNQLSRLPVKVSPWVYLLRSMFEISIICWNQQLILYVEISCWDSLAILPVEIRDWDYLLRSNDEVMTLCWDQLLKSSVEINL